MSDYISGIVLTLLPFAGGSLAGQLTIHNIPSWYRYLNKPSVTPPNWLFGPAWTFLYLTSGYASFLIFRDSGFLKQIGDAFTTGHFGGIKPNLPVALYTTSLVLNWTWTPLFFGAKKTGLAFANALGMFASIAGCIVAFYPINRTASNLFIPYLAW